MRQPDAVELDAAEQLVAPHVAGVEAGLGLAQGNLQVGVDPLVLLGPVPVPLPAHIHAGRDAFESWALLEADMVARYWPMAHSVVVGLLEPESARKVGRPLPVIQSSQKLLVSRS